jgi:hypothetical protein
MSQLNGNLETSPTNNSKGNSTPSKPLNNERDNSGSNPTPEHRPPRVQREKVQQARQNQQGEANEPRRLDLAELFKPKEDGEGPNNESEEDTDDPSKPPDSLEVLSKRLKLKPEQLYDVKIQMPNGAEPVTLGYLKDRVGEVVDLETREMQFDQRRTKAEGELLRSQAEMRDILRMLPKEAVAQLPELVEKVRKRHDAIRAEEQRRTLDVIDDWKDESRRINDMKGMTEFLAEWGFEESFITTIHDHRAMKFTRDMYLRDQKIKKALANVTTPQRKGMRPSAKPSKSPSKPAAAPSRKERVAPDQQTRIMNFLNRET